MLGVFTLACGLSLAFIGFDMNIVMALISGFVIAAGLQEII
jgi:hypothetical protein